MTYVIPNIRIKEIEDVKKREPTMQVCKWCHESGHLSFTCQHKGIVLEKKPDLINNEMFPTLVDTPISIESTKWGSNLSLDDLKEKTKNIKSTQKEEIKRIYSSKISLDSLSSTGSDYEFNDVSDFICNDDYLNREHPYTSYYTYIKRDTYNNSEFKHWWLVELDN